MRVGFRKFLVRKRGEVTAGAKKKVGGGGPFARIPVSGSGRNLPQMDVNGV